MEQNQIRDFGAEDREDYLRLSDEFYSSPAVLHGVPADNFTRTFDKCLEKSPYLRGLALIQEGNFAGYCLLSFTWSNEVGGIVVLLEEAYVSPDYQGHGLGRKLLHFIEEEYKASARRIRLEVTSVNQGAIKLYSKLGYEPFDYLQMVKELPGE